MQILRKCDVSLCLQQIISAKLIKIYHHPPMRYHNFGNSGLKISALSLGTATSTNPDHLPTYQTIIKLAIQKGINYFDTAEMYGAGKAETLLGICLKNLEVPREEVVIGTKILTAADPDRNSTMSTNRKHIKQSTKKSLLRLQIEYVDILYAHIYDHDTPLEQICRGFHEVIEQGLSFYWATSNWQPEDVFNALAICQKYNLHKPIGAQNNYNMFTRRTVEIDYQSLFSKYNFGLIAWSPLAGGILTGKYLRSSEEIGEARFSNMNPAHAAYRRLMYDPYVNQKNNDALQKLEGLAKEIGCKLAHLALAWVLKFDYANSALIGVRNAEQLEDCLTALEIADKLDVQSQRKINDILDNTPEPRMDFTTSKKLAPMRPATLGDK